MNSIDTRSPFFPNSKTGKKEIQQAKHAQLIKKNSMARAQELNEYASKDAKVTIPSTIKDFARIKRVADTAPDIDNTEKIANLKAQIQAGSYQPDYDAVADRILETGY